MQNYKPMDIEEQDSYDKIFFIHNFKKQEIKNHS